MLIVYSPDGKRLVKTILPKAPDNAWVIRNGIKVDDLQVGDLIGLACKNCTKNGELNDPCDGIHDLVPIIKKV